MLSVVIHASLAQGPGNGIAKTTYTAANPLVGQAFNLKYFPTTAAIDGCLGNECVSGRQIKEEGRVQLVDPGFYTQRNCALWSATGSYSTDSSVTNMLAPASAGSDCSYYSGYKYDTDAATLLFLAFAPTQGSCCKACASVQGCIAASFYTSSDYLADSWDTMEGTPVDTMEPQQGRRLQPEPYRGEGFGLHLVNVKSSKTTGGIEVVTLEDNFATRLGSLSKFDAFMDYSVQLFTADLPYYASAFAADGVSTLAAYWTAEDTQVTWYSLFVHVPKSQMIIELVGLEAPGATPSLKLEARVSPRNRAYYKDTAKEDLHLLYATSVTRATSNMTAINMFYTNILSATVVQSVDTTDLSRRCYMWGTALSDVCFVQRKDTSNAAFTVKAFEQMLWSAHSTILTAPSVSTDKFNDNHYAADLQISGASIVSYMTANNPYPLSTSSWWGYACAQHYLIDPTGWTIQTDLRFPSGYPGCSFEDVA